MKTIVAILLMLCTSLLAVPVEAQSPPSYGPPITLEQAKKVLAGAEAEAKKNNWSMAITVLDPGGHLVTMSRQDNTQFGSIEVARDKAYSAVAFRRPTKAFQDGLAQGGENLRLLKLTASTPIEGGIPIVIDGKVAGAVGVSGGTSQQDAQVAKAGADALSSK